MEILYHYGLYVRECGQGESIFLKIFSFRSAENGLMNEAWEVN